jgi:hypothetical protein
MRRWLFADQLGPHFLADPGQELESNPRTVEV